MSLLLVLVAAGSVALYVQRTRRPGQPWNPPRASASPPVAAGMPATATRLTGRLADLAAQPTRMAAEPTRMAGEPTRRNGPRHPQAELTVPLALIDIRRNGSSRHQQLGPGTHAVGRLPNGSVQIDHPSVSRRHLNLIVTPDGVRVRSLAATNGLQVNGRAVTGETTVFTGDVLQLCDEVSITVLTTPLARSHA